MLIIDWSINWLAVAACTLVSMVVGSLWYGPVFGKKFQALMGMANMSAEQQAEMKKGMMGLYIKQILSSLLMFFVLALLIINFQAIDAAEGIILSLWLWLGFVVPTQFGRELWGGKMGLFWLGAGNMLVTLVISGAILGAWQ
jgi:hypothetical protein